MFPFDIGEPLGQGNMGSVYRGEHVRSGLPVAIKALRTDRVDKRARDAFASEVRAMAGLAHPRIALVYDHGFVDEEIVDLTDGILQLGAPYIVMEYASDGSLQAEPLPLPWSVLRAHLLSLLDALAHAHARGVIHRDIKPANILVSGPNDPRPGLKLADFGIAHHAARGVTAGEEGTAVGTPAYMAPEQFRGAWRSFGPWTDLYAVGGVAFHLATGHYPFDGATAMGLAKAHLKDPPPELPATLGLPPGFQAWIHRAMQKAPHKRFRTAADAAFALRGVSSRADVPSARSNQDALATPTLVALAQDPVSTGSQAAADSRGLPPVRRPPFPSTWYRNAVQMPMELVDAGLGLYGLREVPLVGRTAERDVLWAALQRVCTQRRPGAVVLSGGPGIGKTRLASWLVQRATELGAATGLTAVHGERPRPDAGLAGLVAQLVRGTGLEGDELKLHVIARARQLGLDEYGQRSLGRLAGATSEPIHDATEYHNLLLAVLGGIAAARPVVVAVDDAQWGSDAVQFVLSALAQLAAPVLFVVTLQSDVIPPEPVAEALNRLRSHQAVDSVELHPLGRTDRLALVNSLLGIEDDLAQLVANRSEGIPLFAIQLVGDWIEREIFLPTRAGFVLAKAAPEIPDSVHELWLQRLDRVLLGTAATDGVCLEVAAVLGVHFSIPDWHEACAGLGFTPSRELVPRLLRRRLLMRWGNGLSFPHGLMRESLQRLAQEGGRLGRLHLSCGRVLAGAADADTAERAARHLLEGGAPAEALGPLARAAHGRLTGGAFAEAAALWEDWEAIARNHQAPAEMSLRSKLSRAHLARRAGRRQQARDLALEVLAVAQRDRRLDLEAAACVEVAMAIAWEQSVDDVLSYQRRAHELFEQLGDEEGVSSAAMLFGLSALAARDYAAAGPCFRDALAAGRARGDKRLIAEALLNLAKVERADGQFEAALARDQEVLAVAEELLNPFLMANGYAGKAEALRKLGRPEEALGSYQQAIEMYDRTGSAPHVAIHRVNLALTLLMMGRCDEAEDALHAAATFLGATRFRSFVNAALIAAVAQRGESSRCALMLDALEEDMARGTVAVDPDLAWCLESTAQAPVSESVRTRAAALGRQVREALEA